MATNEENKDVYETYKKDCIYSVDEFLKIHNFSERGLTKSQVEENKTKYGLNIIKQSKPKKWYHFLLKSLFSSFNIILLSITLLLIYTDVVLPEVPSYANIIVILVLIVISSFLEFFEVYKSNKAAEKLKKMVSVKTTVIRNGKEEKIPLDQVTIGDVIKLSPGDLIPADLKIIEANDLFLVQSSLTGESDAVRKNVISENKTESQIEDITDIDTICFMGTNVMSGTGKGIVLKIADNTYFGKVAHTIQIGKPKTSFENGIDSVSKLLIRFMLIFIGVAFFINSIKHDTLVAFTFAVAIAIAITPLLLPVILSSSLAKGAVNMAKKETIVKKLNSIQSFGAMNILCTDKTGTLTQDKIVLEKYLNINGEEDEEVLKYAFINAYFQNGLEGSIDKAIVKKIKQEKLYKISKEYKRIDEIPFDFSRRCLSVIVSNGDQKTMITKGAVEEILSKCISMEYKGQVSSMKLEDRRRLEEIAKNLNQDGLRIIAICKKTIMREQEDYTVKDENKMTLVGFVGFLDPPKSSAKEEIKRLNKDGIRVIVLTGDNEYVTKAICKEVDINTDRIVLGNQIEKLSDTALQRLLKKTNVFAKLSPIQKSRIVQTLEKAGNVVGYMGDGINDAPSLNSAEVGVSVDTAVDITKETADIILLRKNLNVLTDGVIEGRKTFSNLLKYIKIAVSSNFGEVISVMIASLLLPFFPLTPIQLLVQSLLYDLGQLSLPYDNVDKEYIQKPRKWDMKSIKKFMYYMGPTSSIFDLVVFALLWFAFGIRTAALFQTTWFCYGIVSTMMGLHVIRSSKRPFLETHASIAVYATTILISIVTLLIPFTPLGSIIGLVPIPLIYIVVILGVSFLYCMLASFVKKIYIKKYGEWL